MFRDNDGIYGDEVNRFLVGTGIEEVKTAYRSPWQNPFLERYIGTLRRELLDHVLILSEGHLKRLLKEFIEEYYHITRPHQGLDGDPPFPAAKPEPVIGASRLVSFPVVGDCITATFEWRPNSLPCGTITANKSKADQVC